MVDIRYIRRKDLEKNKNLEALNEEVNFVYILMSAFIRLISVLENLPFD